ncbi:MAG TPA: hypothetical protein P5121_32695 [Caldilineaceae bacterium]|nr:hypothetical protein [Caldilineaceae bacterium]
MIDRIRVSLLDDRVVPSIERQSVRTGTVAEFASLGGALDFLDAHPLNAGPGEFRNYEIRVEFSNGDKVEASFVAKEKAREFLRFIATQ